MKTVSVTWVPYDPKQSPLPAFPLATYTTVKEAYLDVNRLAHEVLDPLGDEDRHLWRRGRLEIADNGAVKMAIPMRDAELYQPLVEGF